MYHLGPHPFYSFHTLLPLHRPLPNPDIADVSRSAPPAALALAWPWRKLLAKGFRQLEVGQKAIFNASQTHKLNILAAVLKAAEDARQRCAHKQWKFTAPGGRIIVLRDVVEKIAGWVDRFKACGDTAVQSDPAITSLVWAGVRFLLTAILGDVQLFGSMAVGLERITALMYRCKVLEDLHRRGTSSFPDLFENSIVQLYSEMLVWLSETVKYFQKPTMCESSRYSAIFTSDDFVQARAMSSITKASTLQGLDKINNAEAEVYKIASLADTEFLRNLDTTTVRLLDKTVVIQKSLDEVKKAEFFAWLSSTPVAQHHHRINNQLIPGSGAWLLNHAKYQEWLNPSSSSMLLIHGVRGSGKSSILSAVVDSLKSPPTATVSSATQSPVPCSYFYCSNSPSEPDRGSPEGVLRALVKQLATYPDMGSVNQSVWSAYEKRLESVSDRADLLQLEVDDCVTLLIDLSVQNPAYIAIDAIDELEEHSRATLISALQRLQNQSINVVKILLTSRDNAQIQALLPPAIQVRVAAAENRNDIQSFVEKQLTDIVDQRRLLNGNASNQLLLEIKQALLAGAQEM